jgi:hypothetical protein
MKKLFGLLASFLVLGNVYAQPDNQVIASAGGYFVGSTFTNSFTIGEMAVVDTYVGNTFILTQGFQQPNDFYVYVPEIKAIRNGEMKLFPNPNSGDFSVSYELIVPAKVNATIHNLLGQIVHKNSEVRFAGKNLDRFDIKGIPPGIYLLEYEFIVNGSQPYKTYQKINLVN